MHGEIIAGDKLKAAFAEAAKDGKALESLKVHGCAIYAIISEDDDNPEKVFSGRMRRGNS